MPAPIHDPELDRRVKNAGASKTVYALVTPETEAAKNLILGNCVAGPDTARRHHLEQFRDAWTGKQFASHEAFLERWMVWAAPVVAIDAAALPWRYPTAGGSEALFHVIAAYGNRARGQSFHSEVHIFAGEYEGYKAYAEACGIAVVEHPRADWEAVGRSLPDTALFCLSQPSAIDGNVWPEANAFSGLLAASNGPPRLLLDVTYVGAIAEPPAARIAGDSPAVLAIVFSLSKPLGSITTASAACCAAIRCQVCSAINGSKISRRCNWEPHCSNVTTCSICRDVIEPFSAKRRSKLVIASA
jgi:hypothetical protein